jgi:hypothetical protein
MALRVLIAGLLVAAAVGGGVWLHGYRETQHFAGGGYDFGEPSGKPSGSTRRVHPSWADPIAIGGVTGLRAVRARDSPTSLPPYQGEF